MTKSYSISIQSSRVYCKYNIHSSDDNTMINSIAQMIKGFEGDIISSDIVLYQDTCIHPSVLLALQDVDIVSISSHSRRIRHTLLDQDMLEYLLSTSRLSLFNITLEYSPRLSRSIELLSLDNVTNIDLTRLDNNLSINEFYLQRCNVYLSRELINYLI